MMAIVYHRHDEGYPQTPMQPKTRSALHWGWVLLIGLSLLGLVDPAAAQEQAGRVQRINGQLRAGEVDAYVMRALQPGDRLTITLHSSSGNLDPALGIVDSSRPLDEFLNDYQEGIQRLLTQGDELALGVRKLRDRSFLAWDDDSGTGYGASLDYSIPAAGDYILLTAGSLSTFGRATSGRYELLIGLNAPWVATGQAEPAGAPLAELLGGSTERSSVVEERVGSLSAESPAVSLPLLDIDVGETLSVYVEATSGNLLPTVILRDYGSKALEASNLGGQASWAALSYPLSELASGYALSVQAAALPDGTPSAGDYRILVGINAPEVLSGQAEAQGEPLLAVPTVVQVGFKILRISEVDSQNENYTVLGSMRMDWSDARLAFSPDSCHCAVKLYTEKEFDRFLADVQSRWPDFAFFNQLGNRWIKSRAAAIWPDGRVRYIESFSITFQADFDFQKYPFDEQTFPIYLDMLYPNSLYSLTELPGYSEIDSQHGEDEFVVGSFSAVASEVQPSAAESPVARMVWSFRAPRHMNYYLLQVFLPITLIILISWFTFFLRDYTRRIEAAAGNVLLFIAFNFSLAGNYPRLGYITFLDAIMGVTFVVNVLVLLYNVNMKRLENRGELERYEHIDRILDWAYPFSYVALIGLVALFFF